MQGMADFMPANWRDPSKRKSSKVDAQSLERAKALFAAQYSGAKR